MTTVVPYPNETTSVPSTPGYEVPGAYPREHTRQHPLSDSRRASDRPQPISLPSTEKEGSHPGDHCGGVGPLPGNISETSVAKLPDERASEGKAVYAPPSRTKEITADTDPSEAVAAAVDPASSSPVAEVPDEPAGDEGEAASESALRSEELTTDTGRGDAAVSSEAAPDVTKQDTSPVQLTDQQGPNAVVSEQVPVVLRTESSVTESTEASDTAPADPKFKEELRREEKSSGGVEDSEGLSSPPQSRAAAAEEPAPPKGDNEDLKKAAAVQQQQQQQQRQQQPEIAGGGPGLRKGRSSSDSDPSNSAKASIMNRVKGEMKVLLGKASGNRDKVEEGEKMKHGAQ